MGGSLVVPRGITRLGLHAHTRTNRHAANREESAEETRRSRKSRVYLLTRDICRVGMYTRVRTRMSQNRANEVTTSISSRGKPRCK